ncbi:MAG: hypothetical protein CM1200mP37_4880 [Chloroflexota bacterium]|nr:MAG: hypothetical protein CM1200mP37_4880 [Chloroflexota bacterium]
MVVLSGDSMYPSLRNGDILVTLKWPHFEKNYSKKTVLLFVHLLG